MSKDPHSFFAAGIDIGRRVPSARLRTPAVSPKIALHDTADAICYGSDARPHAREGCSTADIQNGAAVHLGCEDAANFGIVAAARAIAHYTAINAQCLTRPTLAHPVVLTKIGHGLPSHNGRY
jgi:hypothetical protein